MSRTANRHIQETGDLKNKIKINSQDNQLKNYN